MATEWQAMLIDGIAAGGIQEGVAYWQGGTATLIQAVVERDGLERVEQTAAIVVERSAQICFSPRAADGVAAPAVGDMVTFWDSRYAAHTDADLTNATTPAGATNYRVERLVQGAMYRAICKSVPLRHVTPLRSQR